MRWTASEPPLFAFRAITSNKTFAEWCPVLGDEVLATTIMDRFLHHCEVIAIDGPSYRIKDLADLVSTAEEPAP